MTTSTETSPERINSQNPPCQYFEWISDGVDVTFEVDYPLTDSYGYVLARDETVVLSDDDTAPGRDPRITLPAASQVSGDAYYFEVTHFNGAEPSGPYTLTVS